MRALASPDRARRPRASKTNRPPPPPPPPPPKNKKKKKKTNCYRVQSWDYRATALLGHPLVGALVTGAYAVILMTVRDVRGLSERWRLPIILLCMATMPLLGARTSFAVVYGTAAVVMGLFALYVMRGGRISVHSLVGVLLLVPICVVMIAAMFQLGYFDGFLERFSNDKGSAETRLLLFRLFDNFGLRELLVGFGKTELETSVRILGTR